MNSSFFKSNGSNVAIVQAKDEANAQGSTALSIRNNLRSSSNKMIQKMSGSYDENEITPGKMGGTTTGKMNGMGSSSVNQPYMPQSFPDMSQYQPGLSYPWVNPPSNTGKVDNEDGFFSNIMKSFWG